MVATIGTSPANTTPKQERKGKEKGALLCASHQREYFPQSPQQSGFPLHLTGQTGSRDHPSLVPNEEQGCHHQLRTVLLHLLERGCRDDLGFCRPKCLPEAPTISRVGGKDNTQMNNQQTNENYVRYFQLLQSWLVAPSELYLRSRPTPHLMTQAGNSTLVINGDSLGPRPVCLPANPGTEQLTEQT